jgi:hypothetical protein
MERYPNKSGFALTFTLILMALVLIIVVAYLSSTRIERSTSSVHANRLRAKLAADSGLAAAIHLLKDNTRYGNYITAMPAPSPSPASHYTEIYRPADPSSSVHAVQPNDYLRLDNAAGEILVSRASPTPASSPMPQVDPRPTPEVISTPLASNSPFALATSLPTPSSVNSFDFNQIVRVGTSNSGRLVDPDVRPAWGQWVNVRNILGEAIGRYAFFIEDESMKVNVNVTGNSLATPSPTASPNLRVNDLSPIPATTPPSQIQEIDPTALLLAGNRQAANTALIGLGNPAQRLPTRLTTGLLGNWASIETYAHLLTTLSKDENTTGRGWQRLDLNALVLGAANNNAAKAAVATRIANWIHDAWTGPTALSSLQYHQMFNDNRLRLQIAANIVDYIDQDSVPTDMGDIIPEGYTDAVPVIGIEKIPYLEAVEVIYEASDSTCPTPPVVGTYSATLRVKIQFRFFNLFETTLDLADSIGTTDLSRIEISGLPIVSKNGTEVLNIESQSFTIKFSELNPVIGPGTTIPAGTDGTSDSGARTFVTDWLKIDGSNNSKIVSFTVDSTDQKPRFLVGKIAVKVVGNKTGTASDDYRLDDTAIVTNLAVTGYNNSSGNSTKDFLTDANPTTGPLQIASINLAYGFSPPSTYFPAGDPRYRGRLINDRWRNIGRTDASTPPTTNRIAQFIDTAELNSRAYGVDWFDNAGDRPLALIKNGPMLNIGELGNVAATEYYWRTLYLQHPERPTNTSQAGPVTEAALRRRESQDYVLQDLFRTGGGTSRDGALNINTQQQFLPSGGTNPILPLHCLFLGVPIGVPGVTPTPQPLAQATATGSPLSADRIATNINSLISCTTVAQSSGTGTTPKNYRMASVSNKRSPLGGETPTTDNNPPRPYFQIGELAPTLSRLISASEASDTTTSSSTSKVVYSTLRSNPTVRVNPPENYRKDFQVEQAFREISNSITTRGNVFRVLYVGQALKNGIVQAEYLGEGFVERQSAFAPEGSNPDAIKTTDSTYKILINRVITE